MGGEKEEKKGGVCEGGDLVWREGGRKEGWGVGGRRSCVERRKKVREGCGREEILCGEKEERKGGVWQGRGSYIHATRVKASLCMGW